VVGAEEAAAARAAAEDVRALTLARLQAPQGGGAGAEGTALLGPAPLFRLRGRERQVLVVKTAHRRAAVAAVGAAVAAAAADRRHAGASFSVDVDPQ